MKTTIFAVIFAFIGMNAAFAADNTVTVSIPSPTQLVETELLPKFNVKVKMEAKGWFGKCSVTSASEFCADKSKRSDKPAV